MLSGPINLVNYKGRYLCWNMVLMAASPVLAFLLLVRLLRGKSRDGWKERWGHLPYSVSHIRPGNPRIWLHAVSAGEVVAAIPILRALKSRLPDHTLLVSVTTPAGYEIATKQASGLIHGLFYLPFDFPHVVQRVIRAIHPDLFVCMESELWPNLLHLLKVDGCKIALANGRKSERSFLRARMYAASLFEWMLSNVDLHLMQSENDAVRIADLSRIPRDSMKIKVLGNSKFDQEISPLSKAEVHQLRRKYHLPDDSPILVAGSTRSTEEETVIIDSFIKLRETHPTTALVIAPRHISRAEELWQRLCIAGLKPVLRSSLSESDPVVHCLVLDTMGELANVYAVADIAFVGNSFPPVVQGGGQNILQPLAHGKPVFVGPFTGSIRTEIEMTVPLGIVCVVQNSDDLACKADELLSNKNELEEIAAKSCNFMKSQRGVSSRVAEELCQLIAQK